jgi:hypothetical protein
MIRHKIWDFSAGLGPPTENRCFPSARDSGLRTALSAQTRRKPRSQPVNVPTLSAYATAQGVSLLRAIYTTNAIEALNSKLRRAIRVRGHFPSDEAAAKLLYLILNRSEKEWVMPPREWAMAKAQFAVIFGDRFVRALAA